MVEQWGSWVYPQFVKGQLLKCLDKRKGKYYSKIKMTIKLLAMKAPPKISKGNI